MTRCLDQASIVVTTYGGETAYTEQCLERIAAFKDSSPEVVVVVHDASPLLNDYLEYCRDRGVVDHLVWAESGHGHLRGVNLGMARASRPVLINVNIDVEVSLYVIDHCVRTLLDEPRIGLIGWHYRWGAFHRGTQWRNGRLQFNVRYEDLYSDIKGELNEEHRRNIQRAWWYTGRTFKAAGSRRLVLCNTSFFAVRRAVWRHIGGFDWHTYHHAWADDFLCYALLEQGYDVLNLPTEVAGEQLPALFSCYTDLKWREEKDPLLGQDRLSTIRLPNEKHWRNAPTKHFYSDKTMTARDRFPKPVFIISPCTRCGSNYVKSLLCAHPLLGVASRPLFEDHFLRRASLLERYAQDTCALYASYGWIEADDAYDDRVLEALGRGLLSVLYSNLPPGLRALTKTPSAEGLELFDRLFPDADLVLLVRDGRAAVASIVKAFDSGRDHAIELWREGVRAMEAYRRNTRRSVLMLRYEDIVRDEAAAVRRILEHCDLDPEIYPYEGLPSFPVVGSSVARGDAQTVHWRPVPKPADFDPLHRFSDWSAEDLDHFHRQAGAEIEALGYETS
jgi:GT2 family glycosyltransferase